MLRNTGLPLPPATRTYGSAASSGSTNVPFGNSTSTSSPICNCASDCLNAESRSRVQKPSTPGSFGEVTTEKVDPATALWLGVKETWFVIDQTLSYIGNVFTGRASADQIGRPTRIGQI